MTNRPRLKVRVRNWRSIWVATCKGRVFIGLDRQRVIQKVRSWGVRKRGVFLFDVTPEQISDWLYNELTQGILDEQDRQIFWGDGREVQLRGLLGDVP